MSLRGSKSFANVTSMLALITALGGSAYAAVTITGAEVKNESLTGRDVRNNSLRSIDIRTGAIQTDEIADGTIAAADLSDGLLSGATGASGAKGDTGPKGDTGATGAKGDPGAPGLSGGTGPTTVRTSTDGVPVTCSHIGSNYECFGGALITASCGPGEYATGGGQEPTTTTGNQKSYSDETNAAGTVDRPNPTTGTPTGWTVRMYATSFGPTQPTSIPARVYVVCAPA
jgi:hypothetical protein